MKYHWLAHHLVQERFPHLDKETRGQIVSEAVCRAWCSFLVLDYRLMQSCVTAAAQRKGLVAPQEVRSDNSHALCKTAYLTVSPRRSAVIQMSEYRNKELAG